METWKRSWRLPLLVQNRMYLTKNMIMIGTQHFRQQKILFFKFISTENLASKMILKDNKTNDKNKIKLKPPLKNLKTLKNTSNAHKNYFHWFHFLNQAISMLLVPKFIVQDFYMIRLKFSLNQLTGIGIYCLSKLILSWTIRKRKFWISWI